MRYKNSIQKGSVRYIIFKEKGTWYGVALEFNLVEQGNNPEEVIHSLFEGIRGYVETVKKAKLRSFALNQKPDKEYEVLWNQIKNRKQKNIYLDKQVYTFGQQFLGKPAMAC